MELSFILLLLSSAFALVASGGAWAQASLGPTQPIYGAGQRVALGLPSILGALFALLTLVFPQFDVSFAVLCAEAAVACSAALWGVRATRGAVLARGTLWPLAALLNAWALTEAVGLL